MMAFSTERTDALWWLMVSADENANRGAARACSNDPQWREDIAAAWCAAPSGGSSAATGARRVANAWGVLAMERFSAKFETTAARGRRTATLDGRHRQARLVRARPPAARWISRGRPAQAPLAITHDGRGRRG